MPRYKDPSMERCYQSALQLAADPASEFYHDGKPRRGAGHRCAFWDGFAGMKHSAHVVPGTMSAAFFQAGKEWAKRVMAQLKQKGEVRSPTPEEIKTARVAAGLSQTGAASVVHSLCRSWQQWEAGDRKMHPAFWELFCIKTRGREPHKLKAAVGNCIVRSVRGADGVRKSLPLKVVAILGDPKDPQTASFELEDGSFIGNWELAEEDVRLAPDVGAAQ